MVKKWFTHQIEANKNTNKLSLCDFWIFVSNFFYKPLKKNPGFLKFRNFHKILVIIRRNLGRKSKKSKREFVCIFISFNLIGESTLYHKNSGPQLFYKLYHKIVPKTPKHVSYFLVYLIYAYTYKHAYMHMFLKNKAHHKNMKLPFHIYIPYFIFIYTNIYASKEICCISKYLFLKNIYDGPCHN